MIHGKVVCLNCCFADAYFFDSEAFQQSGRPGSSVDELESSRTEQKRHKSLHACLVWKTD